MSTVTQAQPTTRDSAPTRLVSPPLALTFLAEFSSLTSFFLLLSVLPMHRLPGGVRPDRHRGAGRTPGRPARAEGHG
jgi:hypothetical protein